MKVRIPSFLYPLALALSASIPLARAQDAAGAPPPPPPSAADSPEVSPPPPPPRRGAQMLEQLKAKLSLTDGQITQVKQIVRDQREQGQAIRQDTSLSDDDRRAKMLGLMKTAHDQIRAILTPDQQKIFDSMPMGRRRRPPPADGAADAPPPMPEGAALTPPPPPPSN